MRGEYMKNKICQWHRPNFKRLVYKKKRGAYNQSGMSEDTIVL